MTDRTSARQPARDAAQPYAIVIGLDCIQGLQSARILAARGVPVIGIAKNADYYACKTRVCEEILYTNTGNDRLVTLLEEIADSFSHEPVLFPCQDKNVLVLAGNAERLSKSYRFVLPDHELVEMMMDKAAFYRFAQREGLPIPKTFILDRRADVERAACELSYPCILKPSLRLTEWSKHTKAKAMVVRDAREMLALYDRCNEWSDALIAQDMVNGGDTNHYTCNCYVDRQGEVLVTMTSQKLRQWQPQTGQACLAVETRNETVERETARLFTSVDYRGLGYLEMKRDDGDGNYYIIEPNIGRPTGRAALAEATGVELLYTMYCDAADLPLPASRHQQHNGVKWIHVLRDLQASAYHLRRRELSVREWWRSVRGPKVEAIFSWKDPAPFVAAVAHALPVLRSTRERRIDDV